MKLSSRPGSSLLVQVSANDRTTSHSTCDPSTLSGATAKARGWVRLQAMVNDDVSVRAVRVSDTVYNLTLLSASGTPILSVPKYEIVPLP